MPIVNRIGDMQPEIATWRQDIHAHPELQFDVHRTAGVVAEKLKDETGKAMKKARLNGGHDKRPKRPA